MYGILKNHLKLGDLTISEKDKIKDRLTFKNPQYENVKRFSKWGGAYTKVPKYLMYYKEEKSGELIVPVGLLEEVRNKLDDFKNLTLQPKAKDFPQFVLTLREDQEIAVENFLKKNKDFPCGNIILPTGKGKSITGLQIASRLSTPTLVIVHKDDLVRGWLKDIELAFSGKMNVGLIKGKSKVLEKYITVATIQTLNRLSDEQLEKLYKYFGLVIVDEAHHISASSFYLVNNFYAKYKMGLTATPERADGLAHLMKLYLGGFCYEYEKDKKSKIEKDILPVQVIEKTLPLYFNPLCKIVRNKFEVEDYFAEEGIDEGDLIRVSDIPYQKRPRISHHLIDDFVVSNVVKEICKDIKKEYELNRSIVVFFSQKEHCRAYFDYLVDVLKIKSADIGLLYGDNKDNEEVLKKAESKRKFITLTTYAKSTEGTNVKQWEVVFLASSVSNEKNVEQAVGRVRRITDSEKLDKVLVYDYRLPKVYTYSTHSKNRNSRYLKLGFEIVREGGKKLFSRGF